MERVVSRFLLDATGTFIGKRPLTDQEILETELLPGLRIELGVREEVFWKVARCAQAAILSQGIRNPHFLPLSEAAGENSIPATVSLAFSYL